MPPLYRARRGGATGARARPLGGAGGARRRSGRAAPKQVVPPRASVAILRGVALPGEGTPRQEEGGPASVGGRGRPAPDFDLPTVHGGRVRAADFAGHRPVLLACASLTDPVAASAGPVLRRLHREFGDDVAFVTAYVREAHPGERIPAPRTVEERLRYARALRARDGLPWTVAADEPGDALLRQLGGRGSGACVLDAEGRVVFETAWANDERGLRAALAAALSGRDDRPVRGRERLGPKLAGLARQRDVVRAAGPGAVAELRRTAPLRYAAGEAASLWHALTPAGRGFLVGLLAGAAAAAASLGLWAGRRLARRRG